MGRGRYFLTSAARRSASSRLSRPRTRSNSRYMLILLHLQLLYTPVLVQNPIYKRAGDSNMGWGGAGASSRPSRPRTRSNSRCMSVVLHLQLLLNSFPVQNATFERAGDSNLGWGVACVGAFRRRVLASLEAKNTVKFPLHVDCTPSTTIIHLSPGTNLDI